MRLYTTQAFLFAHWVLQRSRYTI